MILLEAPQECPAVCSQAGRLSAVIDLSVALSLRSPDGVLLIVDLRLKRIVAFLSQVGAKSDLSLLWGRLFW
jgi:hypothetical protein